MTERQSLASKVAASFAQAILVCPLDDGRYALVHGLNLTYDPEKDVFDTPDAVLSELHARLEKMK